jgi:outer membrane protein assembly factor BamD (BamD/ComL family)
MKKTTLLVFLALLATITGCKPSREKSVATINTLEKRLFSPEAVSFSKPSADSLLALYDEFIERWPSDTITPSFVFKAANVAMNAGNGGKAIGYFNRYLQSWPDKPRAPLCLFFKAFVYENVIHDIEQARENYVLFIEKYPSNEFNKDAQLALMNLGKTPEQMVREFDLRRKADSARVADSVSHLRKRR